MTKPSGGRMRALEMAPEIVDKAAYEKAVEHLRGKRVRLPTLGELAAPAIDVPRSVGADEPHADNLFRVHWYNDTDRTARRTVPAYLVVPRELTGVPATIVAALGCTFPMIGAHKVLAAYACLAPRLVTGRFDPSRHKAVWPSTGNYCRGGVAISRILGCRGVAVLPEGMSRERFDWLQRWVTDPADIVRTPGTESNVKEIYDKCAELERDPAHVILNQFAEFGNYLGHYSCTGPALDRVFDDVRGGRDARLTAFVAASGSAGTLAAGDYLKEKHGTKIVAVEASECPTLLRNGFGEHNIQGIGDKHVPLIHNVMNTDLVIGVSDESTDALDLLFNSEIGAAYLGKRRGLPREAIESLRLLGFSGIANVVAAIKTARRLELDEDDVVVTVATDSAAMYGSERRKHEAETFPRGFDEVNAGEVFGQHLAGAADNDVLELTHHERSRVFNLGYYTWVEQQGLSVADFERRRDQRFWRELRRQAGAWDALIEEFNGRTGMKASGGRA